MKQVVQHCHACSVDCKTSPAVTTRLRFNSHWEQNVPKKKKKKLKQKKSIGYIIKHIWQSNIGKTKYICNRYLTFFYINIQIHWYFFYRCGTSALGSDTERCSYGN